MKITNIIQSVTTKEQGIDLIKSIVRNYAANTANKYVGKLTKHLKGVLAPVEFLAYDDAKKQLMEPVQKARIEAQKAALLDRSESQVLLSSGVFKDFIGRSLKGNVYDKLNAIISLTGRRPFEILGSKTTFAPAKDSVLGLPALFVDGLAKSQKAGAIKSGNFPLLGGTPEAIISIIKEVRAELGTYESNEIFNRVHAPRMKKNFSISNPPAGIATPYQLRAAYVALIINKVQLTAKVSTSRIIATVTGHSSDGANANYERFLITK